MRLAPFVIAAGAALGVPTAASAAPPAQVAAAGGMVQLPSSLHPKALGASDVGRLDPAHALTSMSLLFRQTPQQKVLLQATLGALQDPLSPSYHRWLTPEQYAARFGASPDVLARASAWLSAQGLNVQGASRMGTRLSFSGTAAQVEQAFATQIHLYDVDGATRFAMSQAPSVPAELADVVIGVHGVHDFRIQAPPHTPAANPLVSIPVQGADGGMENVPALGPADFAAIYDLNALYAANIHGEGQNIAIAGQTDFNDADIALFRSTFGLSATLPTRVLVPNSGPSVVLDQGDLGETELDLEWSGGLAPAATVHFVYTGATDANGVFDALTYAIEEATAPVLSISYGQCEAGIPPADAVFYEQMGDAAAIVGVTVLAASGDTGAAGCDSQRSKAARHGENVGLPASIPTVVAVGGTQFDVTAANQSTYFNSMLLAGAYIPESGWNETQVDEEAGVGGLGASTGGASVVFAKPYWQIPFTPMGSFRDVPDIALSASALIVPYVTYYSWTTADSDAGPYQAEGISPVGGTSCAAPSFAAILALVNQSLAKANPSAPVGLGNANPLLYALANSAASAAAFHDITTGNNIVPCQAGSLSCPTTPPYEFGYTAGPGYDQVTGLGSIDAEKLATAWSTLTPTSTTLTATPSGSGEGAPVMLSATVASTATANAMTGSVTFYFETFDTMGNLDLGGTLGSVAVTPSTSGNEGGTATLTAQVPGGATGTAKIGAFFGGDVHYLASWSTLSSASEKSTLAMCPQTTTLAPGQTGLTFTTTGGVPPVTFSIGNDSTCAPYTPPDGGRRSEVCSTIDADSGAFKAGPTGGQTQVIALDHDFSYVTSTVNVTDGGAAQPIIPGCTSPSDAGTDAAIVDAATGEPLDASTDGGPAASDTTKSGCGCIAAGEPVGAGIPATAATGLLLGLAALVRRRSAKT